MAIIRVKKNKNYTVMSNYHLQDNSLTLKAKGLLSEMLSLPDDWDFSISGLVAINRENETAIKSALSELSENGYIEIIKLYPDMTNTGRIEYIYDVYEVPKQEREKQGVEILPVENPTQINTNNKDTNNKRLSINIDNLVKAYNQLCPSLPAVQKLTNDRKAKLKSRLKTFDEDEIKACFILAEQSDFLSGRSGRWKANFDWLIKNDTTMQKVLEGAYANTENEKNMSTEDRLKKALMEIQREMQDVRNSSY